MNLLYLKNKTEVLRDKGLSRAKVANKELLGFFPFKFATEKIVQGDSFHGSRPAKTGYRKWLEISFPEKILNEKKFVYFF